MNFDNHSNALFPYAIFLINLGPLIVGLTLGISSSASSQLEVNDSWKSSFSSYLNIGGLIGCLLASYSLNKLGRRSSYFLAGSIGIVGWVILIYFKNVTLTSPATHLYSLLFGRALTGVSIGVFSTAGLPYIMEITNPDSKYKDLFACTCQLSIVFGTVLSYGFGLYLLWWESSALILFVVLILTLVMYSRVIPESPKWLVDSGMKYEAENAYYLLHQSTMHEEIIEKVPSGLQEKPAVDTMLDALFPCRLVPSQYKRDLRVALLLVASQQLTGINALTFHTEYIAERATDIASPSTCAFIMIFLQGLFSVISLFVTQMFPRKRLLINLGFIMALSLALFSIVNSRNENGELFFGLEHSGLISLVSLLIFFIAFSLSWGPIPMLVCLEMFPSSISGPVSAACLAVNWIISFLVTNYFLSMVNLMGFGLTFILYALLCLKCCWFVHRFVRETNSHFLSPANSEKLLI